MVPIIVSLAKVTRIPVPGLLIQVQPVTSIQIYTCLSKHKPLNLSPVFLPDGTKQNVIYVGTIFLHPKLILKDVLYVPSFKHNLLSVSKLLQTTNLLIHFFSSHCTLQDRSTKKVVAIGKECAGLYKLNISSFFITSLQFSLNCNNHSLVTNSCTLWHERLRHVAKSTIFRIPTLNIFVNESSPCEVCPLSKQHRLPFPSSTISNKSVFELIHVDL